MNNILTINENNIHRFDFDAVTHDRYQIGDRVTRCHNCRAVLKVDYVANGCPLCGMRPFVYDSLNPNHLPRHIARKNGLFALLLFLSAAISLIPMCFDGITDLVYRASFEIDAELYVSITATVTTLLVLCLPFARRAWAHTQKGWLLVFAPAIAPYLLLLIIWCVIGAIGLTIGIAYLALCIAIVVFIFAIFSGG